VSVHAGQLEVTDDLDAIAARVAELQSERDASPERRALCDSFCIYGGSGIYPVEVGYTSKSPGRALYRKVRTDCKPDYSNQFVVIDGVKKDAPPALDNQVMEHDDGD
jgi:hypothetical protein